MDRGTCRLVCIVCVVCIVCGGLPAHGTLNIVGVIFHSRKKNISKKKEIYIE